MDRMFVVWRYNSQHNREDVFSGTYRDCLDWVDVQTEENPTFENVMQYHFEVKQ